LLLAIIDDPESDLFPMKIIEHMRLKIAINDEVLFQNVELQKFGRERYACLTGTETRR
jgi:hypothetical protein